MRHYLSLAFNFANLNSREYLLCANFGRDLPCPDLPSHQRIYDAMIVSFDYKMTGWNLLNGHYLLTLGLSMVTSESRSPVSWVWLEVSTFHYFDYLMIMTSSIVGSNSHFDLSHLV